MVFSLCNVCNTAVQLSTEDADNMNREGGSQNCQESNPMDRKSSRVMLREYITVTTKEDKSSNATTDHNASYHSSFSGASKISNGGAMVVQESDNDAGKAEGRVYFPLDLGKVIGPFQFAEHCNY